MNDDELDGRIDVWGAMMVVFSLLIEETSLLKKVFPCAKTRDALKLQVSVSINNEAIEIIIIRVFNFKQNSWRSTHHSRIPNTCCALLYCHPLNRG